MKLEGQKIDASLLTFVDDLADILIEGTPGAKTRQTTENLHKNLKKSGVSWTQAKKRVSSGGWGPNARKNLAKCRSGSSAGARSLSSGGQASWMLAGSGERGRHNDQAKNHCSAHQFLQIRRFMEVKACLFSNQEDSFSVSDQWSCTVRMRAICFFPQCSGNSWSLKECVC